MNDGAPNNRTPENPPAFPALGYGGGMTLRDYFAAAALQGYLSMHADPISPFPGSPKNVAIECYQFADAMLTERQKP